jgi:predicted unusual protein kinase regulating ubiquinone biosynthesis (AarF/ABC1/UbiB family)
VAWSPTPSRHNQIWRFYRVARLLFKTLWLLASERNRVVRARALGQYGIRPNVRALRAMTREFRETSLALGGLLIKLGQFLSARADLLPQEALVELALLQDEVPAEPFSKIAITIERELGAPLDSIFTRIDSVPAGSASLGQVHHAWLRDGREVAVKVQRPDVDRLVRIDLRTLRFVLAVVRVLFPSAGRMVDTRRLYREFSRTVYEELDYRREGHNAERFARMFAQQSDVVVPAIIWEQTTSRVLTLSWVDGIKVSEVAALTAAGVSRLAVAHRLTDLYLRQLLHHGFFHADPHPGNIFVQPVPGGFKLAFVDFGMMGAIAPHHKRALATAFVGVIQQDASVLASALEALGFILPGATRPELEQAIAHLLATFGNMTMGELRDLDLGELLDDVEGLLYGDLFRLPYQFAFMGRAVATLSGVVTLLAPEFNFIAAAVPHARELVGQNSLAQVLRLVGVESVSELARVLLREGVAIAHSVSALPRLTERVMQRVESGDLRLVIESPDLDPRVHAHLGTRIAVGVLRRPVPAWVPLTVAGVALGALALWRRLPRR